MPTDTKYGRVTLEHQRNIGDDEPVFVMRAQDAMSVRLLDVYRHFCELAGSPERHLAAIERCTQAFRDWQATNATKVPSSDALGSVDGPPPEE